MKCPNDQNEMVEGFVATPTPTGSTFATKWFSKPNGIMNKMFGGSDKSMDIVVWVCSKCGKIEMATKAYVDYKKEEEKK